MNEITYWVLSWIFAIIFQMVYLLSVLKWETKPHTFTMFLYAILTGILLYLQVLNSGGYGSIYLGITFIFCCLFFILSFRYGFKEITWSDKISLFLAILWIWLWLLYKNPFYSVVLFIVVDIFSTYPTLRKTYFYPYTENQYVYLIELVWISFSLLAITELNFINGGYLFYILLFDLIMFFLIFFRRRTEKLQVKN